MPRNIRRRRGFSLMELLIVVAILLIIGAIAIPRLNTARMQAQEMAAIRQITTIHTVQTQYQSQFGRFAKTLLELGPPQGGQPGPGGADLIPGDLALGKKTGYIFSVQESPTGYAVIAVPETYNSSGRRTFYSDESLVVKENWGQEPATAASPEIK
jgi:prepilin-type N-terminal cleavage/methylation domain-containing protein